MRLGRRLRFGRPASDTPIFDTADRQSRMLLLAAAGCVLVAIVAGLPLATEGAVTAMRLAVASGLVLLAGGFVSAGLLSQARRLALRSASPISAADQEAPYTLPPASDPRLSRRARRRATWQQAVAGGVAAVVGLGLAASACTAGTSWLAAPGTTGILAAASLVVAFLLLVIERHLATFNPRLLPEASVLAALVRLPIAVLLLCGLGCLLLYGGITRGAYAGRIAAILCLAVSAEMTLRALATLFIPFPPTLEARPTATSLLAGALVLRRPRPVAATVRDWLGIDLTRSWAIAFVRAAFAPVLTVLVLFGWGLTGVEALRVDQRAIYERLGRPVAVYGPGLHVHLPWPLGRLRPVEYGVLHDVPIVVGAGDAAAGSVAQGPLPDAEAQPGPEADRLWDETHPSEAAYLVASLSRSQQSFQSVDIDIRVVYRIGLSDAAAMAAAYTSASPQRLVQAYTSRLLAHYFAHHTLADVLGPDRAQVSHDITTDLQAKLDAIPTGIQIMAVVVEAIHPPPGAATAYHAVQTAAISAHTTIAEQTGYAVSRVSDAQRQAGITLDQAAAASHETVVDATVNSIGFAADRQADAASPTSFLLERKLDRLASGLAHKQVLIIDHRLRGQPGTAATGEPPIIDMRPPGSGSAAELPSASGQPQ